MLVAEKAIYRNVEISQKRIRITFLTPKFKARLSSRNRYELIHFEKLGDHKFAVAFEVPFKMYQQFDVPEFSHIQYDPPADLIEVNRMNEMRVRADEKHWILFLPAKDQYSDPVLALETQTKSGQYYQHLFLSMRGNNSDFVDNLETKARALWHIAELVGEVKPHHKFESVAA